LALLVSAIPLTSVAIVDTDRPEYTT
jgi:hypothetical protein